MTLPTRTTYSLRSTCDFTTNALSAALDRARAAPRAVIDMTTSNPTLAGVPYDADLLRAALGDPGWLRYEPAPFGLASAREAVAREASRRGPPVDASRVVLTASTSEAYSFLFKLLADPGDEVLVPVPSYPLFEHLARLESVRVVPYRLAYDGAWHVDLASLRAAVSRRARAIVVVSPNNPTGSYLKHTELDALAALGLPIVSDEVFASYPLREDDSRAATAREAAAATLVFSLGGLSKAAALPQAKLAWIVASGADSAVAEALARLEIIADAFLSVGGPVQHALPALLRGRGLAHDAIAARIRANLARARAAVDRSPVSVLDVEGGWYATLRLPRTRNDEEWALVLLEQDDVFVHPGHFFDFEGDGFAVVSLLTPEADFGEGMSRLVARVTAGG